MTKNQIDYVNYLESNRHNVATEEETKRNNIAVLKETNRHNVVNEKETYRSNVAREQETKRHNKAIEDLGVINAQIQADHYYRQDSESKRSHMAQEDIQKLVQAEVQRSNRVNESISSYKADTDRMELQMQQLNAATNRMNAITNRMNADTNLINANTSAAAQATTASRVAVQNQVDLETQALRTAQASLDRHLTQQRIYSEQTNRATQYINATSNLLSSSARVIGTVGSLLTKGGKVLVN